jgi:acyl carrier protein
MHFGATVRDVISESCGVDVRDASARTPILETSSPEMLRRLGANLERAFGVAIPDADLAHFTTISDVLRCVRLRRWAWRAARLEAARQDVTRRDATRDVSDGDTAANAVDAPRPDGALPPPAEVSPDLRERLIRYTRREPSAGAPPVGPPASGLPAGKRL